MYLGTVPWYMYRINLCKRTLYMYLGIEDFSHVLFYIEYCNDHAGLLLLSIQIEIYALSRRRLFLVETSRRSYTPGRGAQPTHSCC